MRKIPLWARMTGQARRSQDSDRSGSMVAGGASLPGLLVDGDEVRALFRWAQSAGSESENPHGPPSGPSARRRRPAAT